MGLKVIRHREDPGDPVRGGMGGGYLVDAARRHGAVVEAQERSHGLLAPGPVAPAPQVHGAVVPDDGVRRADGQAGVQVRLLLAQARLRGEEPARGGGERKSSPVALHQKEQP